MASSSRDDARGALDCITSCLGGGPSHHFWAILLNAQNHYLMAHLVSTGTQSSTLVHPREVLGPALREGAASLILIHNHPSGDPTPSREDTRLTRQLVEAAQLMDLRIHDHVIIGSGSDAWVSFATRGLM